MVSCKEEICEILLRISDIENDFKISKFFLQFRNEVDPASSQQMQFLYNDEFSISMGQTRSRVTIIDQHPPNYRRQIEESAVAPLLLEQR